MGSFLSQCLSINTLDDFVLRGKGKIYKIIYPNIDLNNMDVVRQQLSRALQMAENSEWDYNPFTNNCQHWSRFVTTSEKRMNQCDILASDYRVEEIRIPKSRACESKSCDMWYTTKQGKYCKNPTNT